MVQEVRKKMNKGRLIVFSAPSGCGKGTMLAEILKDESFRCSISATTRKPREGEADGVNYYFITNEEFEQKLSEDAFLEHAGYCDHYYGTLRPDALFVFIAPPSVNELRRRLHKRGTESEEVIEQRVAAAHEELTYADKYDYVIVNDALEDAVSDFFAVVRAEQLTVKAQSEFIDEVIKNA